MSPTAPRSLSDFSSCAEKTLPLAASIFDGVDRADADERDA